LADLKTISAGIWAMFLDTLPNVKLLYGNSALEFYNFYFCCFMRFGFVVSGFFLARPKFSRRLLIE